MLYETQDHKRRIIEPFPTYVYIKMLHIIIKHNQQRHIYPIS